MIPSKRYSILAGIWILLFAAFCMAAEDVWTEVSSPNFIVISNASPKQAGKAAKSFEQFRILIKSMLPALNVDPGSPLTVFAARDEKTYKELLAEERPGKKEKQTAGMFLPGPERDFVVFRIDLPEGQGYHVIYHEYVHMLVRLNYGELPLWLEEGLAEFFGYATLSEGSSNLGTASPESLEILRTRSMIPLSLLFSVNHDSPQYTEEDKAAIFYAQSWALTHYLMIGDKQIHAKKLSNFIALLQKGIPEPEAAVQALGDLKALEQSVRNYVHLAAFYSYKVSTKLTVNEDQYQTRTLSPAESLASRGELLVYMEKPDRAQAALEQSLRLEPRSARANEAMGYLFMRLQNQEKAEKYFAIASEMDSKSYMAQFYVAQSMLQQEGTVDFALAESRLRKSIAINPQFAPAFRQLSYALQRQAKLPEALEMAEKAALLEPGEWSHRLNVASILAAMGKIDQAYDMGRQILALARSESDRSKAESFVAQIRRYKEQKAEYQQNYESKLRDFREIQKKEQEEARKMEENYRAYQEQEEIRKARVKLRAGLKRGPAVKLLGNNKTVQCDDYAAMDIVLESKGKQYPLYAENYYDIQFWAAGKSARHSFDPCSELQGKNAEIEFLSVDGQDFSGFIKTVTIYK